MRSVKNLFPIIILLAVLAFNQQIQAQGDPTDIKDKCIPATASVNFKWSTWLNCKTREIVIAKVNQSGVNKQVQTPSIADSTTSLVDQTEAPDVVGFALNFAGLNTGSDESNKSATTITSSAYAIYAAATKNDPLDPAFYTKNSNLRKFSFNFGREAADENNSEGQKSATLVGFKYLILNKRDASNLKNRQALNTVGKVLELATGEFAATAIEVQKYLFAEFVTKAQLATTEAAFLTDLDDFSRFHAFVKNLSEEQVAEITRIINKRVNALVTLDVTNRKVIEKIRRKPQLSFTYQSKLRPGNGDDEHRTGLIFDFGVPGRLNFALNGTFDYKDSKTIGGDTRGGRFAAEAYYQLNPEKRLFSGKDPLLLSFSSESKWMSNLRPTHTGQVKLTIPLFDGVNLPISVSYANRKDLIKESHVEGKFGFTIDFAKIAKGFQR